MPTTPMRSRVNELFTQSRSAACIWCSESLPGKYIRRIYQYVPADRPLFSCSESEQKQLNTWGSFQSAEQSLLGQFSVSRNTI